MAGSGSDLSEELVAGVEPAALDSESPPIVLPDPLLSPLRRPRNPPNGFYRKCISSSGSSSTR